MANDTQNGDNLLSLITEKIANEINRMYVVQNTTTKDQFIVNISTHAYCSCGPYFTNSLCDHVSYILKNILHSAKIDVNFSVLEILELFNGNKPLSESQWTTIFYKDGNSYIFQYVPNQTRELCETAITKNPVNIRHIREQTEELKWYAFNIAKEHGHQGVVDTVLDYIQDPPLEMCLEAIDIDPNMLRFIENQTDEMCLRALRHKTKEAVLSAVRQQTPYLCREAIKCNPENFQDIDYKKVKMQDIFRSIIFEDVSSGKIIRLDEENDIMTTIYNHIGLIYGTNLKENAIKLYESGLKMEEIVKNTEIVGVYIVKVNENLYEIYTKDIIKMNNGWIRNNIVTTVKSEKVGRYLMAN